MTHEQMPLLPMPTYPLPYTWAGSQLALLMSLELRFERLTKTAVAFPAYMYSVAKLHKILHIPTLFANYIMDSSEIICLRVQHLFVSYKENIRKGITLNPQLVAASQLVGNLGFSIILTVFWKLDIKWMGHELLFEFICYQLVYEQRVDYSDSSRINCSFILSVIGNIPEYFL